jgi:hypothetical protein
MPKNLIVPFKGKHLVGPKIGQRKHGYKLGRLQTQRTNASIVVEAIVTKENATKS